MRALYSSASDGRARGGCEDVRMRTGCGASMGERRGDRRPPSSQGDGGVDGRSITGGDAKYSEHGRDRGFVPAFCAQHVS